MKHQSASRRERLAAAESVAFDPQSGVMRCATTVRLTDKPLTLDVGTADRTNLGEAVRGVLEAHKLEVVRHEAITTESPGVIDRFHLEPCAGDPDLPAGQRVAIQVALLEALDPELRWVAREMAELYPDEH